MTVSAQTMAPLPLQVRMDVTAPHPTGDAKSRICGIYSKIIGARQEYLGTIEYGSVIFVDFTITGNHSVLDLAEPGKKPQVRVWYQFENLSDPDEMPEILDSEWSGYREIAPGQILHCEAEVDLIYKGDYMVIAFAETGREGRLLQQASRLFFRVDNEGIGVYRCHPDELNRIYWMYTRDFFTPWRIAIVIVLVVGMVIVVRRLRRKSE